MLRLDLRNSERFKLDFLFVFFMEIAYVVGPYTGVMNYITLDNINNARNFGEELKEMGFIVEIPHDNYKISNWFGPENKKFMKEKLEILKKCDLAVAIDGWEYDFYNLKEKKVCEENKIPFYASLKELIANYDFKDK
jgi:hypothetical protein